MTDKDKIELLLAAIEKGNGERAGCCDNEEQNIKDLTNRFFSFSDEDLVEFCNNELIRIIAYGG